MKKKELILILMFMFNTFGSFGQKNDFVFEKFKATLEENNFKIDSIDEDGLIHISINGGDLKVSLENTRKKYETDSDEQHIINLVQMIKSYSWETPKWEIAKDKVYIQLFPNYKNYKDFVSEKVTDEFSKAYVLIVDQKETYVTLDYLKEWNITELELKKQANINTNKLLEKAEIDINVSENRKIGMIDIEIVSLKCSLLFATEIKEKLKKDFGFPFYAVIPVRDFCYVFSEKDYDFFSNRLGAIVLNEYKNTAYPITTEILKFSEKGIEAVAEYLEEK